MVDPADPLASRSTRGDGLGNAWRDALNAHARYFEEWGQLTSRWVRDLAEASKGARLPDLPPLRLHTSPGHSSTASADADHIAAIAPPSTPAPVVLVLEGATGELATAAFLVENSLPNPVVGEVEVDSFADSDGATAVARPDFDPAVVSLDPGEQRLVRVSIVIPPSLRSNLDYRSTIRVNGVPGTTIPIRLRRLGE